MTTKTCPYCAENIKAEAIVCKHCKSDLRAKKCPKCDKEIPEKSGECVHCGKTLVEAKDHPDYWKYTILGLLIPVVGIILGATTLSKPEGVNKKLGEHTIAISILGFLVGYFLYSTLLF